MIKSTLVPTTMLPLRLLTSLLMQAVTPLEAEEAPEINRAEPLLNELN